MKIDYRKLYEEHFGHIPVDDDGRTYDIHHIDGNRSNNDPSNLVALSIQEHYDVHFSQGDYGACWKIAKKIKMSKEELSEISRLNAEKQFVEGTHPFIGINEKRLSDGTHHFLSDNHPMKVRSRNGNHHFQDPDFQRSMYEKALEKGRHTSQIKKSCVWCDKQCSANMINRHERSCNSNPNHEKTTYRKSKL